MNSTNEDAIKHSWNTSKVFSDKEDAQQQFSIYMYGKDYKANTS